MAVLDDDGIFLPPGEQGEVVVRGGIVWAMAANPLTEVFVQLEGRMPRGTRPNPLSTARCDERAATKGAPRQVG